jgi:hypothetical protein
MMKNLLQYADAQQDHSLSNRLRDARFRRFATMVEAIPRPMRILDIGGTIAFWRHRGWVGREDVQIVMVNLQPQPSESNVKGRVGDATALPELADGSFDVVFSNSVIEHLFTWENQQRMAREVRRIGRAYWVQTPNYRFPIEPHYLTPCWHWLPRRLRIAALRRWQFGGRGPQPDPALAAANVDEIRLLSAPDLRQLFPDAQLVPERFAGLVKSWIAVRGLASPQHVPSEPELQMQ